MHTKQRMRVSNFLFLSLSLSIPHPSCPTRPLNNGAYQLPTGAWHNWGQNWRGEGHLID